MKNIILFLIAAFSFTLINAQNFIQTEKYTATNKVITKEQEYKTSLITITALEDTTKKVATIAVSNIDFFEELRISVLPNPTLNNVKEVLKVELEYIACCANTETYYFLVTNSGNYISLPRIENMYCDIPQPSIHYIFPNQKYGQEDTILATEIHFTETYKIKDLEILQSFAWNDDDFNSKDAITAIQ